MEPYNAAGDRTCPKCLSPYLKRKWLPAYTGTPVLAVYDTPRMLGTWRGTEDIPESMRIECGVCGHAWAEEIVVAPKAEGEQK